MCNFCNWDNEKDVGDDRDPIFTSEQQDVRKITYGNNSADFVAMIKDKLTLFAEIYRDKLCVSANLWDFKSGIYNKDESYGERAEISESIKIKYCPFCGENLEGRECNF